MAKVLLLTLYEPDYIGTRLLAAYLLKNGHEAHILHFKLPRRYKNSDAVEKTHGYQACTGGWIILARQDTNPITDKEYELLKETVQKHNPDVIGISARSLHDHLMPTLVPVLRKASPDSLIVAGGYGPTLNIDFYLKNGVDAVIRGEGEEALQEICYARQNKNDWHAIENISFIHNKVISHNRLRQQCKNLDRYPAPIYGDSYCSWIEDGALHANEDYQIQSTIYITLLGRGCIGKCSYCCGGQWYEQYRNSGNIVYRRRNRSIHSAIMELKSINRKFKYITFNDELFAASTEYISKFFIEYKNNINKPFFLYASYEQLLKNKSLFDTILDAGWHSTGIGLQSGSERLCRDLYGRHNKNADYIAYAKKLFENNVLAEIHIIGGNCYETDDDFEHTLNIIKKLPFSITDVKKNKLINIRLKPHPQTPILTLAPRVLSNPMPAKLWLYRAALCECRRIMDEETFSEVRSVKLYREHPDVLLALYRYFLNKMQLEYFMSIAQENEGKPVIYYGAGELYRENKHLFSGCNPVAMLLDEEYIDGRRDFDGMPLFSSEHIVDLDDSAPIVIFSGIATMLQRKLERTYKISKDRIHTCTSIIKHMNSSSYNLSL